MKWKITLLFLLITGITLGQVGINTDTPDPSAMLDIMSDDKGFLAPRMDSTSRLDIIDPATGLLVYDTTLEAFQYFDGTEWDYLAKSERRSNFKRIKSIDDLADELVAGGNTKYLLNTDFLYEINGTILVDFPIDLNGAYIEGIDSSEDVLINVSSGSLFEGSKGGGLRNLTLSGSLPAGTKTQLFDINATPGELLLINNTIVSNASKVGTLDGLSIVFLSVTQYVNNDDGFTINDINSFFVSNIFWTSSNTGTFMELLGSFTNLQMNGGRIEADNMETGIDVSANPAIVNDATLSQLSFVGAGTLIDPYTTGTYSGFNFTKDWNVNCSGIPLETDAQAVGDINFNFTAGGGASTTFSSNGVPKKLAGVTTSNNLFRFSSSSDNRVVYEGKKKRFFNVSASVSFEGNTPGDRYIFYIARGRSGDAVPTVIDQTGVWKVVPDGATVGATTIRDISAVPIVGVFDLEPNDYIEVWVERFSGTGQIFTVALNLAIN
ncbi:cell wall anchor protein [Nonlabens dokdonensis]|uniref:Cell wall anchor protein n=1 Tax=Nonlabens dokdonensis TaxID=328515 RepID=A0A1Z8B2D6_9FLAO|nr:cell wall anchor protein [Nonlabens dokdonensis]OUS16739.1 cell wall anchor protein [Nonlabens dokdonensis]